MAPNVFIAFKITNKNLLANLRDVHLQYVLKDNDLAEHIVPLDTAHVTLNVFCADEERLEELKNILREVFEGNKKDLIPNGPIKFQGLGTFGKAVLYAKPVSGFDFLKRINRILDTVHYFSVSWIQFNILLVCWIFFTISSVS